MWNSRVVYFCAILLILYGTSVINTCIWQTVIQDVHIRIIIVYIYAVLFPLFNQLHEVRDIQSTDNISHLLIYCVKIAEITSPRTFMSSQNFIVFIQMFYLWHVRICERVMQLCAGTCFAKAVPSTVPLDKTPIKIYFTVGVLNTVQLVY